MDYQTIEGHLNGEGRRFAIIVARFNSFITEQLLKGCIDGLSRSGVALKDITVMWVPGAWEIPIMARRSAASGNFDAVICLGAVIRGSTPHFDFVAGEAAKGISAISHETGVPAIFGILTTESIEQAIERAGTKMGNKGYESAHCAIEMVDLLARTDDIFRASKRGDVG